MKKYSDFDFNKITGRFHQLFDSAKNILGKNHYEVVNIEIIGVQMFTLKNIKTKSILPDKYIADMFVVVSD